MKGGGDAMKNQHQVVLGRVQPSPTRRWVLETEAHTLTCRKQNKRFP